MSTECTVAECTDVGTRLGLCPKHYFRHRRHGNPYVERTPRCSVCLQAARVLRRPTPNDAALIEQITDLFLLYNTGSTYRLTTVDGQGREYDLEENLREILNG